MTEPVRWGIAATGQMATWFAEGLRQVADAELVAVWVDADFPKPHTLIADLTRD